LWLGIWAAAVAESVAAQNITSYAGVFQGVLMMPCMQTFSFLM
jgi:hypothetical protein